MSNTEPSNPFESPLSPIPRIRSEREQLPPSLQPSNGTFSAVNVFPENTLISPILDNLNILNQQVRHLMRDIQQQQPSTRIDILRNRGSNITASEIEELRNIQEGESKNPNGGRKRRRRAQDGGVHDQQVRKARAARHVPIDRTDPVRRGR